MPKLKVHLDTFSHSKNYLKLENEAKTKLSLTFNEVISHSFVILNSSLPPLQYLLSDIKIIASCVLQILTFIQN